MNPPSVLLDLSFLSAVADPGNANHDEATAIFRRLIDDFVEERCLLVARADHLAVVANPDLFASVDKLHVARQHRNAADDLTEHTGVDLDVAITLVLIHRSKIRKVATFDERLTDYDFELVTPPTDASVAAETEPGPG
jgi:predicted nucleic acid-binding protein